MKQDNVLKHAQQRPLHQWGLSLAKLTAVGVLLASGGPAVLAASSYSQPESHTLTLTVSNGAEVLHSLTPVAGLSDSDMPINKLLATGSFSGTASQYGFKWDTRDGACGQSLACSRVKSLEDANNTIDVIANFTQVPDDTAMPEYLVVNLGTATAGQYTLTHMTNDPVKAGTYRMSTDIGVFTQ
jgi:hypothetical protein